MGNILVLYFASGCTALVYEILWMRELGLLFGNTAQATAATLTAFFIGLAVGGQFWGKRVKIITNPLRTYAFLELGVSVTAMGYFALIPVYRYLYPLLFTSFVGQNWIFLGIKFLLAMLVLFPPAFLIGGTLPVMSQYIARDTKLMSRKVSLLYSVNTLGASIGALAAGFYLPVVFGYKAAYLIAVATTAIVGISAMVIDNLSEEKSSMAASQLPQQDKYDKAACIQNLKFSELCALSMLSGFTTLALQVLWTRMFAQVLQNSVYTFSIIVVVFLVALAIAAGLANRIIRIPFSPLKILILIMLFGAGLTALTPDFFDALTGGLQNFKSTLAWESYLLQVFGLAFLLMGPPLLCLGIMFPMLLRLAEPFGGVTGNIVGKMTAINTWGAAAGALTAGFILLDQLGLWESIRVIAVVYAAAAIFLLIKLMKRFPSHSLGFATTAISGLIVVVFILLNGNDLPMVQLSSDKGPQTVLEAWEGSAATVAVVDRTGHKSERYLVMNNTYVLGGSGSSGFEEIQGSLPLFLHENPKHVFFLGMGTGITAGAALAFPLETVTVAELVPEVITASRKYFSPYLNGLFSNSKVRIMAEDGRNFLNSTDQSFDVIVADLFLPWKAGTGNLYSKEHFQSIRRRLSDDGLFMQWLPAYQVTFDDLAIIARTMLKVFPQVTLWRGDFVPNQSIVGLLGHNQASPLSRDIASVAVSRPEYHGGELPLLSHYIGNLNTIDKLFAEYPINSDDRPIIEYRAPVVNQNAQARFTTYLSGANLIRFMVKINQKAHYGNDPYLAELPKTLRRLVPAGFHLYRKEVLQWRGQQQAAEADFNIFKNLLSNAVNPTQVERFNKLSIK